MKVQFWVDLAGLYPAIAVFDFVLFLWELLQQRSEFSDCDVTELSDRC